MIAFIRRFFDRSIYLAEPPHRAVVLVPMWTCGGPALVRVEVWKR